MHKIVVVGAVGVLAFGLATGSFFAGALLAPLGARTPATGPITQNGAPISSAPIASAATTPSPPPPVLESGPLPTVSGAADGWGMDWGWHTGMQGGSGIEWNGTHGMMRGSNPGTWGMGMDRMGMMGGNGVGPNQAAPTPIVPAPTPNAPVSFQSDVLPIFQARCVACHGGTSGLHLTDYANALRGGDHGLVVVSGDVENSRLVRYVVSGYMPYGGPPLSADQIHTLVNWVAAGAPNN